MLDDYCFDILPWPCESKQTVREQDQISCRLRTLFCTRGFASQNTLLRCFKASKFAQLLPQTVNPLQTRFSVMTRHVTCCMGRRRRNTGGPDGFLGRLNQNEYEELHRILHRLPASGAYGGLLAALREFHEVIDAKCKLFIISSLYRSSKATHLDGVSASSTLPH